ncbi:MAG: CAP domain-containing protein [Ruminococcus sp.]|nr:CAP domain-containing protein [Ruminococcus sp.]
MKKWKKFVFGLLFGMMICFLLPKPVLQTDAAAPFDVNEFIDIASANINAMRMENGLEPLQTAPLLQEMCQERADELTKSYSHSRVNGDAWYTILTDYGIDTNCFAGENIAAGYDTPEGVVEGWMNSAGHRRNILNTNYEYFAVGVSYYENDPEYYFYYWDLILLSSDSGFEDSYTPLATVIPETEQTTTTTLQTTSLTTTTVTSLLSSNLTTTITAMITVPKTSTTLAYDYNYGDCNTDGVVDLRDAIFLGKYLSGQVAMTRIQLINANCNQIDGTEVVDERDAQSIMEFVLLKLDTLPVTES